MPPIDILMRVSAEQFAITRDNVHRQLIKYHYILYSQIRIKSRGTENVQKIFPTWIVGSFVRRLQPNTAEVLRSRFSKNRGRIFYAQKYFSDVWHFRSLRRGRKQQKKFFQKSAKTHLAKTCNKWTEKNFWKRLNFTPLKFQIGERYFSDRWFFSRKCPNR